MKKLTLAIAMAALLVFAGCKKDKETEGTTLKASIEQHESDGSKTSLNPTDGAISWTAGDKITVYNGTATATFRLTSGEGSTNGTFTYNGEYDINDNTKAFYPETGVLTDNSVTFTVPQQQNVTEPGTFANGANPMIGLSSGDGFVFASICGCLGLKLTGNDVDITAIEIVSENEALAGNITGYFNSSDSDVANGTNNVRLNCTTTLTTEAKEFFIVLPPGVLGNGFTMNIYNGDELIFTKTTGSNLQMLPNTVKIMNPLNVETTPVAPVYNFEDGNMPDGWTSYGNNSWYVDIEDYYGRAPAYDGNYSLYIDGNGAYDSDYFVSPALVFDGSAASLSFAYATPDWEGDHNDLSVCYGTSPNGPWNYTSFVWVNSSSWTTATVDLSSLNGTYYIAFESYDGYGYCTAIDNINITGATISRGNITASTNGNGAGIGAGEGLTAKPALSAPSRTRTNPNKQRIK